MAVTRTNPAERPEEIELGGISARVVLWKAENLVRRELIRMVTHIERPQNFRARLARYRIGSVIENGPDFDVAFRTGPG